MHQYKFNFGFAYKSVWWNWLYFSHSWQTYILHPNLSATILHTLKIRACVQGTVTSFHTILTNTLMQQM